VAPSPPFSFILFLSLIFPSSHPRDCQFLENDDRKFFSSPALRLLFVASLTTKKSVRSTSAHEDPVLLFDADDLQQILLPLRDKRAHYLLVHVEEHDGTPVAGVAAISFLRQKLELGKLSLLEVGSLQLSAVTCAICSRPSSLEASAW